MTTAVSHAHARRSGPPPPAQATTTSATATGTPASRTHRKPFSSLMKRLAGLKTSHNHSSSAAQNGSVGKGAGSHPGHIDNTTLYKSNSGPSGGSRFHSGKHRSNSHPGIPTPLDTTSTINTITGPLCNNLKHHHHSPSSASDSTTSSPTSAPKPSNHTITTTATSLKSPSTFSSPAPSVRSLTTTLTTIQSTAPNLGNGANTYHNYNPHPSHHHNPYAAPVLFSNPLPSPSHLHPSSTTPGNNQQYYSTATANGLLTDNASIITLASSSKRRRRHSFDTDASIRALAPASVWGGSRESLPLSILSSLDNGDRGTTAGSIRIPGDRSSLYGRLGGDGASVRGIHSPGINSPISGQGGGGGEYFLQGRENYSVIGGSVGNAGVGGSTGHGYWGGARSRRSSGWGEVPADEEEDGRPRALEHDEDEDAGSVRSRRTASIASEKTGRTIEDERRNHLGGCGAVAVGASTERAESPAPVVLNWAPGKGKEKM